MKSKPVAWPDGMDPIATLEPLAGPLGLQAFADDNNDFALALYGQLRQQPGNLFFSPFSVRTALCMAEAGAREQTAEQMREALCISSADESILAAFAHTIQRLRAAGGGEYEIAVTNSLWGQDGAPLQPEYLDLIARHYGGVMNVVDFRRDAESARATINQWVEDETGQKIREPIPPRALDSLTLLVLVNVIGFKAVWALPFRKFETGHHRFHLGGGVSVLTPLMHQEEAVRYLQAEGFQAVELAYRGGDLSMLVLLPDQNDGLPDLEEALSARLLQDCVARMRPRDVDLFLPRFKLTWGTADLSDQLAVLGMPVAFTRLANFSGINGRQPPDAESLFLSAVLHKATVEVNEEGTAAWSIAAVIGAMSLVMEPQPVPVFRADHPFLFAIRDQRSGAYSGHVDHSLRSMSITRSG